MAVNRLCSHTSSPRRKRAPGRTRRATLLAIAALVGAIPAASPAHAALSDSELLTAGQQMAIASGENAQAQIEMTRDFLEAFADNLSTLAESGHLLNDFSGIQLPDNASPAARAFFNKIGPAQNWLAAGGHEGPDRYALLSNIYDLIDSVHQDLDRPASTPLMAVLSSHTLEKLGGIGLDWISDNGHLQDLLKAGKISAPFAKYAGFLAFGADDLVAGAARLAGGANWQDPETATHLVDALNRGAWAAVGFLVSGGNAEVAKIYSDAANLVASVGRKVTLDAFVTADMQLGGAGAAILDEYIQAQNARLAHNQPAQSFEAFVGFDDNILRLFSPAQRAAADARFGAQAPSPNSTTPILVITRTTHDSYREICTAGFCTRYGLAAASAQPVVGGVRINPQPVQIGRPAGGLGAKVLGACGNAASLACTIR